MNEFPFPAVQRCIDLASDLQQIPSPTFHEDRKGEIIRQRFQALGLADVRRDAVGNILARIPGREEGRPLVFSAHMDTVFPENFPLSLNCLPDRIIGPGIGDNALGLAGLLVLPEILFASRLQPRQPVWLAATTGEEGLGDLQGIRAVADRFGPQPLAYISLEGIGLGNLLHRGLGVERYRISVHTSGGHSWADFGQASAIHELTRLAARLTAIHLPHKPRTTLNIGIIEGGTSINTIASTAWMEVDLRSENIHGLADLSNHIKEIVESSRKPDVNLQIETIGHRPSGELPRDHALIQVLSGILSDLGLEPHLDIASTEANYPLSLGYPSLTIGMTSGGHAHSVQEYILTGPIENGLHQVVRICEKIFN